MTGSTGAAREEIRLLDELAANALPASSVWHLDGWALRHSPEVPMRRANSVLALTAGSALDLDARLAIVERCFARSGRPARIQVGPASAPDGLDDDLAARGYAIEAPVDVCVAPADTVLATCAVPDELPVETHAFPDERWLATWRAADTSDRPVEMFADAYRSLLARVGPEMRAVVVPGIAVALGVRERGWVGVFSMKTHPDHRHRGVGRALLAGLARWGVAGDCPSMYLQVEVDNAPARALYDGVGFVPHHGYQYRTRPALH